MFSARQRFLEQAAPQDDEPSGLAAGFEAVLELLRDPKKAQGMTLRAAEAQKVIDAAKAEQDKLAKAHRDLDAASTAHAAAIAAELKEHQAKLAKERKEIETEHKAATTARQAAEADAKAAAADKAEQRKRLAAVERAVQGAV
jgi:hypothetical protein